MEKPTNSDILDNRLKRTDIILKIAEVKEKNNQFKIDLGQLENDKQKTIIEKITELRRLL